MKKTLVAATIILALSSASAFAQERAGSAALGAVSGAIVLGPVGAVAGALIGYTAGPSISRSWRERPPQRRANSQHRPVRDANAAVPNGRVAQNAPAANPPPVQAVAAPPPPPAPGPTTAPPVQGLE